MAESSSVVLYDPHTTDREVSWCREHGIGLFEIRRAEIELYARQLEDLGRARATIGRRLSTIAGFYRSATEEGLIPHSPAANVRRPRLDCDAGARHDSA